MINEKFLFNLTITITAKKGVTRARLAKVCNKFLLRDIWDICEADDMFTTMWENVISNKVVEYHIESKDHDTAKQIYWKLMDLVKWIDAWGDVIEKYSCEEKTSF